MTMAGNGTNLGEGVPATLAQLNHPTGVAVDDSGNVIIAEYNNYRVREVFAKTGLIYTIAGSGNYGFSGDGGPATAAEMWQPTGVAVDHKGNIYISDYQNYCIRKVSHGIITTFAGMGGVFGWTGDGGPATAAEIDSPTELCVDSAGNVYVTTDSYSVVRKIDALTGIISTVAGTGVGGYSSDGGAATASALEDPRGIAVDDSGNVFINDTYTFRVRKVSVLTGLISTVAGTGTIGSSGDGGPATAATFNYPRGLSIDPSGNLYIADASNQEIRKVTKSTGIVTTIAGNGTAGYSGDGGAAIFAELDMLYSGVALDKSGNVYIGDLWNSAVREVTSPQPPIVNFSANDSTICVGSTVNFTSIFGNNPTSWVWTFTGGNPVTDTARYPSVIYNTPGKFAVKLRATNGAGSDSITKTLFINVIANPTVTFSGKDSTCAGTAITITATGGGAYLWSNSKTTSSITVNPLSTITYSIAVTKLGCTKDSTFTLKVNQLPVVSLSGVKTICAGDSTTITSSGGGTYSWSTGATTAVIGVKPTSTKTYSLAVSNGTCIKDTIFRVTVTPLPTITFSGNDTVCFGTPVTITATGGGTYLWSNGKTTSSITVNPTTDSTFSVAVKRTGCTKDSSFMVVVNPLPVITIIGSNTMPDTLTAFGGKSYTWSTGGTNDTIIVNSTGTYSVTGTDSNGCVAMESIPVVTTGMTQISHTSDELSVFPVPSSGIIRIELNNNIEELKIMNVIGEMVFQSSPKVHQLAVDLTSQPNGVYFIQLKSGNKLYHQKIVKQ